MFVLSDYSPTNKSEMRRKRDRKQWVHQLNYSYKSPGAKLQDHNHKPPNHIRSTVRYQHTVHWQWSSTVFNYWTSQRLALVFIQ